MHEKGRKKVLFLITKSNWGGAQRYVYDLATGLDQTRYEPVVALGGNGTLVEMLAHAGIRVISIASLERDVSLKKEWAFFKELWSIIRQERPHILHVNSSKAGAVGTLVGRLALVKRVIFTAHGWAFNEDRPLSQRLIIKAVHYMTVLCSHKTIAVSNAIMHQMNWPFATNKMKVLHPGRVIGVMYEQAQAREKIVDFFPRLRDHLSDPWIITIAELHPIKQLTVLVAAMKHVSAAFPTARCIIIGEGQERGNLESQIKAHNLNDTVFLAGSITEAARFLKAASLFVLPSRSEAYGYVLHEAALAHVPIIATSVGGIPDIVSSPEEGILITSGDTQQLSAAIIDSLNNPNEAARRADRLERKMKVRTTERMINATTALYELPLR